MNSLFFTIGLPRSGKSTLAKKWLRGEVDIANNGFTDEFQSSVEINRINNFNRVVVSPDAFRLALGHRYNWYVEPVVFAHVQVAIRALIQDYDVLVDDTHTTPESISRILEVDHNATYVYIDTPCQTCIDRAEECGQADLIPVIKRMDAQIAMLNYDGHTKDNFQKLRDKVKAHSSRKVII